jgi:hypothetical protein
MGAVAPKERKNDDFNNIFRTGIIYGAPVLNFRCICIITKSYC